MAGVFSQAVKEARCSLEPQQPWGFDTFKICESISHATLGQTYGSRLSFRCWEIPNEIKAGGSKIGVMSGSRVACRISLKADKMAQGRLQPRQPFGI